MINCYHSINGLDNLKGASIIRNNTSRTATITDTRTGKRIIHFPETEIGLVNNVLKLCQLYITRNPQLFQQPQEILGKVNQAINIISAKTKNQSLKGASDNNNNYQSIINIHKMLGFSSDSNSNNIGANQLIGASKNSYIYNKKKSLINLLETFSIYH